MCAGGDSLGTDSQCLLLSLSSEDKNLSSAPFIATMGRTINCQHCLNSLPCVRWPELFSDRCSFLPSCFSPPL